MARKKQKKGFLAYVSDRIKEYIEITAVLTILGLILVSFGVPLFAGLIIFADSIGFTFAPMIWNGGILGAIVGVLLGVLGLLIFTYYRYTKFFGLLDD